MSMLRERSDSWWAARSASEAPSDVVAGVTQALDAQRRLREEEIRRMLGAWVSEVEPQIVLRAHDGRLLGLAAGGERRSEGPVPIHVYSSYVDPTDPHDQRSCDGTSIEIDIRP